MILSGSDQAICFIALALCLGGCLIRACYEIELWRERRRQRDELVRGAMRSMIRVERWRR